MIRPMGARVLVRNIFDEVTPGGLHIPQVANDRRKVAHARVIAIGPDVPAVSPNGHVRRGMDICDDDRAMVEVDDVIYFMVGSGVAIDYQGTIYLTVKVDEILVIERAADVKPDAIEVEAGVPRIDDVPMLELNEYETGPS